MAQNYYVSFKKKLEEIFMMPRQRYQKFSVKRLSARVRQLMRNFGIITG